MRLAWTLFALALAGSVGAQLFVATEPHFAVERLFAFHALYGFLACAGLILAAKALGVLLKRRDDYYDG